MSYAAVFRQLLEDETVSYRITEWKNSNSKYSRANTTGNGMYWYISQMLSNAKCKQHWARKRMTQLQFPAISQVVLTKKSYMNRQSGNKTGSAEDSESPPKEGVMTSSETLNNSYIKYQQSYLGIKEIRDAGMCRMRTPINTAWSTSTPADG
ncbi:hypothetical protein SK128_005353 [Halocaridina rubra]|uniref:Uncharacterized protein n=1 Tax=Halocaridina rubra TaxID=373956 RepID=A0AAN8WRC5_HALRR